MRDIEKFKTTTNSSEYRKLQKKVIAKKTGLCSLCPWHGGENTTWHKDRKRNKKDKYKRKVSNKIKRNIAG